MNDEFETRKGKLKPEKKIEPQHINWCTRVYRYLQCVQRYCYVVVQFYPWFKISGSFVSNSTSEITIPKNKEKYL